MRTAIVLFTRDLRVHDHPALTAAVRAAERIVPLFVLDRSLLDIAGSPNRVAFLRDALADLQGSLRERGGGLVLREGDVTEAVASVIAEVGAEALFLSEDVSAYAQTRERRLRRVCDELRVKLFLEPGVTAIPPGDLTPAGGDHYRVFTPYWRRWALAPRRAVLKAPSRIALPPVRLGRLPALAKLTSGMPSSELPRGGEAEGRRRLRIWLEQGLVSYDDLHDALAANGTSMLGPYLHFGCLSPTEVAAEAANRPGGEPFVRQLAWRDFYAQLLHARPAAAHDDYRTRHDRWRDDPAGLAAWQTGQTGFPIVDAGMRQLAREGWMHNRARLITASFLAKDLYLDWRLGAAHFFELLVDGDLASNVGNWQWVAGTGVDTRPNRVFNPVTQAKRYDPEGDYVRRYVPELRGLHIRFVHEPWRLGKDRPADYPAPILDHGEAVARFRGSRLGHEMM